MRLLRPPAKTMADTVQLKMPNMDLLPMIACGSGSQVSMSVYEALRRGWTGRRVPEPETMGDGAEVEAYAGAAAQCYLAQLDEGAALRAAALAPGARRLLDIGCGPAGIPLAMADQNPGLMAVGIDSSPGMLREAQTRARQRRLSRRVFFVRGSAGLLPFKPASFALVMSNSLLHHLGDPERGIQEALRAGDGGCAVFMRDLRRPARLFVRVHLALFGRHYRGKMRHLFNASVRAAYTLGELRRLFAAAPGVRVQRRGWAHLEAVRQKL